MKFLKRALVLVGLLILVACHADKPYPVALQQAEHCLLQHPDSALIYLSTLDSTIQQEPEETQMYYALLKTKAMDKKFIKHSSDSLMTKVVRFYESYGDKNKLIEAYYYLGSVYRDMRDAPRAVAAFHKAAEVGENSHRYDVLGRIYEQMGTLFAFQSLYEDALKIHKKSYKYYQNEKDELGLIYALRNQGRVYEYLDNIDSTKYYYQEAYMKALQTEDQKLINSISIELGNVYLNSGNPFHANTLFSKIPPQKDDAIYLYGIGSIHLAMSKPDSAQYYYKESLKKGKQNQNNYMTSAIYKALARIEAQKGNYPSAFEYTQKSQALDDSIKNMTRTEAIGKIHALYNYRHTEEENQRLLLNNQQTQIYIYLLIIVLLLIVGITAVYINHTKKQKRLTQEQINRLSLLKEEQEKYTQDRLTKNKNEIQEIQKQLQQIKAEKEEQNNYLIQAQTEIQQIPQLKARLTEAKEELLKAHEERLVLENKLIEFKRYEALIQKNFFENTLIYKHFHNAVSASNLKKIEEEDWIALEHEIDKAYNNFTDRLKELCPSINQHELRVCYLIKANITPSSMAKILCLSTSAISIKRSRLYHKISKEEGNGEMLDKLITDF